MYDALLHVPAYNNHYGQKYVGETSYINCCLLLLHSYWNKSYDVIVFTYWILGQQILISNMSNMWAFCFSTHGMGYAASKVCNECFCFSGAESSFYVPVVGKTTQSATKLLSALR